MSFAKPAVPSSVPGPEEQSQYEIITNSEQREVIKRRAIDMVEAAKDCEMVVFLDKKARPLSTLFTNLFPVVNPDQPTPQIRFLNIGEEKRQVLEDYCEKTQGGVPADYPDGLLDLVRDRQDLAQIFGEQNVNDLALAIGEESVGKVLVVDELKGFGFTHSFADRVIQTINKTLGTENFVFFDSEKDKAVFSQNWGLPWSSDTTLVRDESRESFISKVDYRSWTKEEGLAVRRDFKMLAQEAAKEYVTSHRHPATS